MFTVLLKGYNIVLAEADPKVPKQSIVLKDTDKHLPKLLKANQKAYCGLTLAYHEDIAFRIVEKTVTKDLPDGDINLALDVLKRRFDPKTSSNKLQLKHKFVNSSLIKWNMRHVISDKDFMIHIFVNLPEEY